MMVFENGKIRPMTDEEIQEFSKHNKYSATFERIEELKNELTSSDYKIIKCYEYNLAGLDLPYDLIKLHKKRQDIRNEINELESKI